MERTEDFRAAVAEAMAAIVDGDTNAIWHLHDLATPGVCGLLRREAERLGVRLLTDDLVGLALDAVLELARIAPGWRPDGALPWVWARRRIEALVHAHVGVFADELADDVELEVPPPSPRPVEPLDALTVLAGRHPAALALQRRLEASVSRRDAAVWLDVQVERDSGNRSPAVTVGAYHDLRPDAVRKVVQRVGERLATTDALDATAAAA